MRERVLNRIRELIREANTGKNPKLRSFMKLHGNLRWDDYCEETDEDLLPQFEKIVVASKK